MKKHLITASLALSITFFTSNMMAFPKLDMGALTGETQEQGGFDPSSAADRLEAELRAILFDVAEAEVKIKEALGDNQGAAESAARAKRIQGKAGLKDVMEETKSSSKATADLMNSSKDLNADAKAALKEAIPPYLKAIYRTSQLKGPIEEFAAEAQNAINAVKSNPLQIRKVMKSLKTGMTVVKNGPGLIKALLGNGKQLVTGAKAQNIEVKDEKAADSF